MKSIIVIYFILACALSIKADSLGITTFGMKYFGDQLGFGIPRGSGVLFQCDEANKCFELLACIPSNYTINIYGFSPWYTGEDYCNTTQSGDFPFAPGMNIVSLKSITTNGGHSDKLVMDFDIEPQFCLNATDCICKGITLYKNNNSTVLFAAIPMSTPICQSDTFN